MKLLLAYVLCLVTTVFSSTATENTNRATASATPSLSIKEVFAKPLSQKAAYEKFRGKVVSARLWRPQLTWVADGGITVNLIVPKNPNWCKGQEVVGVDVRGRIVEILFDEKHLTIECEPEDIRIGIVE